MILLSIWTACEIDEGPGPAFPGEREDDATARETVQPTERRLRAACPIVVTGTEIVVKETDAGAAMTFTTGGGDVEQLRRRVRHMAAMYVMQRGQGRLLWRRPGETESDWSVGPPMPPVQAKVADVERGVELELVPSGATEPRTLRQRVRQHAQRLGSGQCWVFEAGEARPPDART